jgi:hypothetical protein
VGAGAGAGFGASHLSAASAPLGIEAGIGFGANQRSAASAPLGTETGIFAAGFFAEETLSGIIIPPLAIS